MTLFDLAPLTPAEVIRHKGHHPVTMLGLDPDESRTCGNCARRRFVWIVGRTHMHGDRWETVCTEVSHADCPWGAGPVVVEPRSEHAPCLFADGAIESGLLTDSPAGGLDGPAGRADQVGDPQIFDADVVIGDGDGGAGLLYEILAGVRVVSLDSCESRLGLSSSVRPSFGPRQLACCSLDRLRRRGSVTRAIGQGQCDAHTSVYPDDTPVKRPSNGGRDRGKGHMPPPAAIQCHSVGLRSLGLAGPTEADPADLGNEDLAPASVEPLDVAGGDVHFPEPLVPPLLSPSGAAVGSGEEVATSLVEVPKGLLLHSDRPCPQPFVGSAGLGQLPALLRESGWGRTATPPPVELLQSKVPDEPGVVAMLHHDCLLGGSRIEPEPHTTSYFEGATHGGGTT